MKPKLLITLGCSYTSGIGTSDPYHHMWSRQLGIKLGFDKLINLGKAGASNSGCIKKFNEMVNNFPLNEYDILVIFLFFIFTRSVLDNPFCITTFTHFLLYRT